MPLTFINPIGTPVPPELQQLLHEIVGPLQVDGDRLAIEWYEDVGRTRGFMLWPHGYRCSCGHWIQVFRPWYGGEAGMWSPYAQMMWGDSKGPLSLAGSNEFAEAMRIAARLGHALERFEPTSLG